jgi:hypothetical protein
MKQQLSNQSPLKNHQFQKLTPVFFLWLAGFVFLLTGTPAAAATPNNNDRFGPTGIYTGVETSEGTLDQLGGMKWGNSFALNSFGEWESSHLTVSVNYSINQFNPNGGFIVTGGTWSLVVVRNNQYFGTINGEVSGGTVSLITDEKMGLVIARQTQVDLQATGALGSFQTREIKELNGVLNATTDLLRRSKETTGILPLAF